MSEITRGLCQDLFSGATLSWGEPPRWPDISSQSPKKGFQVPSGSLTMFNIIYIYNINIYIYIYIYLWAITEFKKMVNHRTKWDMASITSSPAIPRLSVNSPRGFQEVYRKGRKLGEGSFGVRGTQISPFYPMVSFILRLFTHKSW